MEKRDREKQDGMNQRILRFLKEKYEKRGLDLKENIIIEYFYWDSIYFFTHFPSLTGRNRNVVITKLTHPINTFFCSVRKEIHMWNISESWGTYIYKYIFTSVGIILK